MHHHQLNSQSRKLLLQRPNLPPRAFLPIWAGQRQQGIAPHLCTLRMGPSAESRGRRCHSLWNSPYRIQLPSCFVAEIRTEFDQMYLPMYHLSYKKKSNSMQNPPTFAKNLQHPANTTITLMGAYTYTSFSPASFPWLSAAFKEITFISKKCDICHYLWFNSINPEPKASCQVPGRASAMYGNMCREKQRSGDAVWQIGTWLWRLSFQLPQSQEESLILFKLLLDLLTAKQWDFAAGGSSLQCGWALFFSRKILSPVISDCSVRRWARGSFLLKKTPSKQGALSPGC